MELNVLLEGIPSIWKKTWRFAKKYTALFLGISTAAVSVVTLALNMLKYCYDLGYYHYFYHIPLSYLGEMRTSGVPVFILLYVALTCFVAVYTLMGREAYRRRKYGNFFWGTVGVAGLFLLIPMSASLIIDFSFANIFVSLGWTLVLALYLSVIINIGVIGYCISSKNEDKLERHKIKCEMMRAKLSNLKITERKRNKLDKKLRVVEGKITQLEKKEEETTTQNKKFRSKERQNSAIATSVAMTFIILLFFTILMGIGVAALNKEHTIVVNQDEIYAEMSEEICAKTGINSLVVLHQNNEGVIVSPCYTSDNSIIIYSEYQRILPVEDLVFRQVRYLVVEMR